ncbi:uncharacterized protein LOC109853621 [Pseudomyrmex gracilis]|uniref:uncharacterized protein LOC109853621 n=1 Tax=Pseudomyrmex gracilis TaxID=219809 RepID=UPI00099568AC|nr:uncharacterized protein LOC109853621 [Pseudomyrmex gracilis]XP_020281507.1 uncharacterized protein LOC109853621 [Pseudomyrmex gracilis]
MTRDRKLLLLLGLLMAYGLFVAECRYHQHEDAATTETRHRHRHKHESSSSRRSHHEIDRRGWKELEDYDAEYDADSDEPSPIDEDDYDAQSYYNHPRSHHRSAQRSYHSRTFEPRYPPRYHVGGDYHARGLYDEDNNDRRRIQPSRYNAKNHRYGGRTYYRPAYSRNREVSSDYDYDDTQEDYKRHRYEHNGGTRKNFRRHDSGRNWRNPITSGYRGARKHRLEVVNSRSDPWNSDWRRRSNSSESKYHFSKSDESEEDEDYEDHGGLEEDDRDDEDELWKDVENEENDENEDDVDDDNVDFYKKETKPLLKTYDDIIRRLTSDDSTTSRSTVKRDYRNLERHARRDGSRNHKPQNHSRTKLVDLFKFTNASHPRPGYFVNKQTAEENSTDKFSGATERKSHIKAIGLVKGNDRQGAKTTSKMNDTKTRSSPEQDYDEYLNTSDNEKEDDLVKAGVVDDSDMQADVTNTDYTDDDNGDESETLATSTIATTATKPVVQHYDYKDPRSYDSGTGAQYNGYQAKNDYPPMSAHSVHKWQLLGTRESVKETRNNMQLHKNKNDEIKEALQHAVKVHKEGNCQWPRARLIPVRDVYPNPSTTYLPHCAILHRCSDDTGCCRSETLTCVPKHSQRVELSFYTTNVTGSSVVEKLSFYNHTECECRARHEYDATNERGFPDQRASRHHHHSSSSPPENMKKPKKPCRCPSQFTPRITQGVCQCYCYDNNDNCVKTRRGKAHFSLTDRICIQKNECAMPHCEFGDYIESRGKCPRKTDTFNAMMTPYRTTLQHRPRS